MQSPRNLAESLNSACTVRRTFKTESLHLLFHLHYSVCWWRTADKKTTHVFAVVTVTQCSNLSTRLHVYTPRASCAQTPLRMTNELQ